MGVGVSGTLAQRGATTTIVQFTGRIEQGDLVLDGRCISCGGPVARVIEGA
jgi:hypothetical protein